MSSRGIKDEAGYDVFISHAHADEHVGEREKVSALVRAMEDQYQREIGTPLRVFHGPRAVESMDDWEATVLPGLRQSRLMLAILSPAYFASAFCRREWERYVQTELARALPGEGIIPIYVARHPAFEADPVDKDLQTWIKDLRRRWCIDWLSFWPQATAFREDEVRRHLAGLSGQIAERLKRAAARDASFSTVPAPGPHFVGRRDEIHMLLSHLIECQKCVLGSGSGIPGVGTSTLAFAYAWGHGSRYPGGRFLIRGSNLGDLAAGMIGLAEFKGVSLGDQERKNPHRALAKIKSTFEQGPPALLVIDNLDDPLLFSEQARNRALPGGDHIHVLVTTCLDSRSLPGMRFLPLGGLTPDDAETLLQTCRTLPGPSESGESNAACEIVRRFSGHALAIELAGVCLGEFPDLSYGEMLTRLEHDGVPMLEDLNRPLPSSAQGDHVENVIGWLLEAVLSSLSVQELRAVEYAAFLPPDLLPLPWLRDLLVGDFPPGSGGTALPEADGPQKPGASEIASSEPESDSGVDLLASALERLQRLRLIMTVTVGPTAATPGKLLQARIHRLVQGAIRARMKESDRLTRLHRIYDYAQKRGELLESQSPVAGLEWELPCLRELALSQVVQEDRSGFALADRIAGALIRSGRMLDLRELWRLAVEQFRGRHQAQPDNAGHAFFMARSLQRLGNLAQTAEDSVGARRYHAESLRILARLTASFPENAEFAQFLSTSHTERGELERLAGAIDEAKHHYEFSLRIARRLADLAPANPDRAADLARCLDRLGELATTAGDPDEAQRYLEESQTIRKRLAENSGLPE